MEAEQQRPAGVPDAILRQYKLGIAEGWVPANESGSGFVYKIEEHAYASYPPGLEFTDQIGIILRECDVRVSSAEKASTARPAHS